MNNFRPDYYYLVLKSACNFLTFKIQAINVLLRNTNEKKNILFPLLKSLSGAMRHKFICKY
jgi:hypothetical protein